MTPTNAEKRARAGTTDRDGTGTIAFFSMEVALDDSLPTFSGGLGVLAGDFLRSAADLALPVVAVTLLYRKGYFVQHLDPSGHQSESPVVWKPEKVVELLPERTSIEVSGRTVALQAWVSTIRGCSGHEVPLYLLDTDLPENDPEDRAITDQLYAGDQGHRLRQEIVLGLGGVTMLEALSQDPKVFHMNEGHCSLLTVGLLHRQLGRRSSMTTEDVNAVRNKCVFTTHTPVPAGHDRFDVSLVNSTLDSRCTALVADLGLLDDGELNMTDLGLRLSGFANGVSLRHREVSREMFPGTPIGSITNGVHVGTWAAPPVRRMFDRHLEAWQADSSILRYTSGISLGELGEVHEECKGQLIEAVERSTGTALDPRVLTIGLARRATPYKRTALLFTDPDRLRSIAKDSGPIQVVCSGKAHPQDEAGKELITRIVQAADELRGAIDIVFLEGYDLRIARLLCAGSDIWLNTPEKPHEASGTSGMKAAINGVPSLSILDGWWIEGCVEGVTGWAVGDHSSNSDDADALYNKLGGVVAPLFYGDQKSFRRVMRNAIALNGSFFNTERMVREYATSAYGPARKMP